ncbi:MAG: glycosyl hydrolase [Gammaproteobacteria bacterium]|nr:glycosyl hydrolase [Gammaproteobacteria bacterium]
MSASDHTHAPGAPGLPPTWTSSAKQMVGTALGDSRIWYTIGHGIVNEVYYPRIDIPQIRDLGFIVADDKGFWVEVKRLHQHTLRTEDVGVPAVIIRHTHTRFELLLRITPDPERDVLLLEVQLQGDDDLAVYALLAPHLGGSGHDNVAMVGRYRGRRVLWAEQGPFGLALAAVDARQRDAFRRGSAGYVGFSDGWQDFAHNKAMHWQYDYAGPGNVALMGKLPKYAVLALGFGTSRQAAATLAISSLLQPFDLTWQQQVSDWRGWHAHCATDDPKYGDLPEQVRQQLQISSMILRVHQDKIYPGAMVASLSIPWGNSKDDVGGYHLVWPRDLVECAGALTALGADYEARNILRYLIATQHADGHWYQNQWLGGKPYWQGIQLDEAGFPVLLATALMQQQALDGVQVQDMIRRALGFIACHGPASDQDRWEEDSGVNTFTLAVCIAALVSGAQFLDADSRDVALALADYWNAHIEDWTAVSHSQVQQQFAVDRYYVRVAPVQSLADDTVLQQVLPIKNRVSDPGLTASEQIGTDFLQLVRFGLRRADDPVIVDSIKVIDALLKVETPSGPSWHRYNGDGYGEHADGRPFDGSGRGRLWPLLTGERGHYEFLAGRDPMPFINAMLAMSGEGGMLPEQVWDSAAIPDLHLYPGKPSGSAMPLAWTHAEFVKLVHAYLMKEPIDRPQAVWQRYQGQRPQAKTAFWLQQAPINRIHEGMHLYIGLHQPSLIRWGSNDWRQVRNLPTWDSGIGLHIAELDTRLLTAGETIEFTYRRAADGVWIGRDYKIAVAAARAPLTI